MEKDKKPRRSFYHPPFVSAMHIELRENKDNLLYEDEHRLNTDPLLIDLLIIKKDSDVNITSGLGRIFRKINIWEYKSPEASLGYKEFHKGLTYAPENISYRDISVSFLRHAKPVKLMKMLLSEGYTISEYEPGIYHVSKSNHQPYIQIIVSRMLDEKYGWIKLLSKKADADILNKLAAEAKGFGQDEKHYAAHTLDFINNLTNTNKEDTKMGIYADYFNNLEELENANKEIKNQDEQIKNQDKTIKTLQKELKKTNKENSELKKKLLAIEKKLSNIAVL